MKQFVYSDKSMSTGSTYYPSTTMATTGQDAAWPVSFELQDEDCNFCTYGTVRPGDTIISTRCAEVAAVRGSGARLVAVSGKEATTTWRQLEIIMTRWRSIEELAELPGPFIYTASRTSLRKLDLDLA